MFTEKLKDAGWKEIAPYKYAKGDWKISFDTSSWMEIGTKVNPRLFDIFVPRDDRESAWTINLIEHLCRIEDERFRLRSTLEKIHTNPESGQLVKIIAEEALRECYHTWLVKTSSSEGESNIYWCPICKREKKANDHE